MQSNNNKEHYVWIDIFKIIAIFAVIVIHSAAPFLAGDNQIGTRSWWIGNIYDSLSRWCIPVFVMLTGSVLLMSSYENNIKHFFVHKFRRIVIPFFAWSIIYFLWRKWINHEDLLYSSFVKLILKEPLYYHLWYLYIIIALYLLTPIISVYIKNATKANVNYFIIFWIFVSSLLPVIMNIFDIEFFFNLNLSYAIFPYLGYFILGFRLIQIEHNVKKMISLFLICLISIWITMYGTYLLSLQRGVFNGILYEYYSPNVLLLSMSLFLIVKLLFSTISDKKNKMSIILKYVASCVPGIYLVHALIISLINKYFPFLNYTEILDPVIGIPLFACTIFFLALISISILRIIPGLKVIIPL